VRRVGSETTAPVFERVKKAHALDRSPAVKDRVKDSVSDNIHSDKTRNGNPWNAILVDSEINLLHKGFSKISSAADVSGLLQTTIVWQIVYCKGECETKSKICRTLLGILNYEALHMFIAFGNHNAPLFI
jgi:hypothetical protein